MVETTDESIISLKSKTFAIVIGCVISFTFTVALIYFEFQALKKEIKVLTELQIKDDANTNGRINKITGRNSDRIKELEKSNSDNK